MRINFIDRVCEYKKVIFYHFQPGEGYNVEFKEANYDKDILVVYVESPFYATAIRERVQSGYLDMVETGHKFDIKWRFIP